MEDIFKSNITLKFKRADIEKAYQSEKEKEIKSNYFIYTVLIIILSISYNIIYSKSTFDLNHESLLDYIKLTSFYVTGIQFMLILLSAYSSIISLRWIIYFNIYFTLFSNVTFRIYLLDNVKIDDGLCTITFFLQQFFNITSFYINSLEFFDGFVIYLALGISTYATYSEIIFSVEFIRIACDGIVVILLGLLSYFYNYEKRNSYHSTYINNLKVNWYKSIIAHVTLNSLKF